jgi:GTP-binding protein EngB required for normal cell division
MAHEPAPLNEHQQRHLYFGLAEVDRLLIEVEGVLAAAQSRTLFPRYVDDLDLSQRRLLEGSIARLRAELAQLLASQGMVPQRPQIEASGAIRTALIFAEVAAEELGAGNMRGYGELSAGQAEEVEGVVAELRGRIAALLAELAPEPAAQLEARIAAQPASPAQELLARLERVTRERGLAEFRAALNLLAARMAAPAMEIAVFGRVSCGKSSLLNYLLGADVLPTGVTPITAVPTRVGYGAQPQLTAEIGGTLQPFPLGELAALASEEHNPDNRLGITRLEVAYPSTRLRPGVVFVDTPGLGSIRSWGAMQTLAYLPKADMAMLLVDAGGTLGNDELELVRWMHHGGVPVQVALSKADRIAPAELEENLAYVREVMAKAAPGGLPVRAVSVRNGLADAWFARDLQPLYERLQERFQALLERRLAALRDGVLTTLRGAGAAAPGGDAPPPQALLELERKLRRAEAETEQARAACRSLGDRFAEQAGAVTGEVAQALAEVWEKDKSGGAWREVGGEALGRAMVQLGRPVIEALHKTAEAHAAALREAERLLPGLTQENAGDEPAVRELPMPEAGPLPFEVRAPKLPWLGAGAARSGFRRQLAVHRDTLAEALRRYGLQLQQRAQVAAADMERQFQARADIYRAAVQRLSGALRPEAGAGDADCATADELAALERWQPLENGSRAL